MRILFVSLMGGEPWGGSEELWSQTARYLHQVGHEVSASVHGWAETPTPVAALRRAGIPVQERRARVLLRVAARAMRRREPYPGLRHVRQLLTSFRPEVVCLSHGVVVDDLGVVELVAASGIPWCNIAQANTEWLWPCDDDAQRLRAALPQARRCFFVSAGNLTMLETQLACRLPNAEIVRNPYNVAREANPAWPDESSGYRLACVGRLDPHAKGQDLLLHALARTQWRDRPLRVSFFGAGRTEQGVRGLIAHLGLEDRAEVCGRVADVASIWAGHHGLVLPSRCEGLPLAVVEAMLCGRPAIVTDVAGNAEIVEDGVSGFVAAAPTIAHVSEALERAWEKRSAWRRMGLAARARAQELVPADPIAVFADRLLSLAR